MKNKKVLIAIPARGGSKRLPRKNVIEINGLAMIAYTINAAIESGLTDDIYVCTEDSEIATISKDLGVKVFSIPDEMAGDEISSTTPCLELIKYLANQNVHFDYLYNLQPTSPLRNDGDINKSFEQIMMSDADFLVSTTIVDPHFCHWVLQQKNDWWSMLFEKKYLKERPQLPNFYRPNGAIKLGKVEALLKNPNYFGDKLTTYEMPEERSIHVATLFDVKCVLGILNY